VVGDVVERDAQAVGGEQLTGRVEEALPVLGRIAAQWPALTAHEHDPSTKVDAPYPVVLRWLASGYIISVRIGRDLVSVVQERGPLMASAVGTPATIRAGERGALFTPALVAALLGFFIVTFDAVVLNVALPTIQRELGSSITGLQWIVDGYTLMFAAFLLTSGVLSDRVGARRAFGLGVAVFAVASLACGLAPNETVLIISRFVQGTAAAVMMPSSMALLSQSYRDPAARARAISLWGIGGGVASSSGPVLGGLLTVVSWRLIFLINVPVAVVTLWALRRSSPSPRRATTFDWAGQVTAVLAMGGLTFAAIEAGIRGFTDPLVVTGFVVAVAAGVGFFLAQSAGRHPMLPAALRTNRVLRRTALISFAFMVSFYGLPFLFTLFFQQQHGRSALATGVLFLPMMLTGAVVSPFSARIVDRLGARRAITSGLVVMIAGCVGLAVLTDDAPLAAWSALLGLIGLGGPFAMLPSMSLLLNNVPHDSAGTASGVLNSSRQLGGALAVAVFGALLAGSAGFTAGVRISLGVAAAVALVAVAAAFGLRGPGHITTERRSP
jgi:EmrB/QacA subfamily drug resistance transporter